MQKTVKELTEIARKHWEANQPTMFAELTQSGKLEDSLKKAAEWTHEKIAEEVKFQVEENNASEQMAEHVAREKYMQAAILLPDENEKSYSGDTDYSSLNNDMKEIFDMISEANNAE